MQSARRRVQNLSINISLHHAAFVVMEDRVQRDDGLMFSLY